MATHVRFGRQQRTAPSLTSTIVSLAQQYQAARDRNIEDAWKNGGQFEGAKVTDASFLAHWKERLAGVSQDDPQWDYYNNLIHQYQFTIAESKIGQSYAEKKTSDAEMASFYRSWAKKLPVDSEAYRNLMTQAAKFVSAATSRGYGNAQRTRVNNYNASQQSLYNHHEAPYQVMTDLVSRYAVTQGILDSKDYNGPDHGWSKLTGADDPTNFSNLLTALAQDPTVSAFITRAIRQYDPTFSGQFNNQTLTALGNNARNGAITAGNAATAFGSDKAGVTAAGKRVDQYSLDTMVMGVSLGTPGHQAFIAQDQSYRTQMDNVLSDAGATPLERQNAVEKYGRWLSGPGYQTFLKSVGGPDATNPLSRNFNPFAAGMLGRIAGTLNAIGQNRVPELGGNPDNPPPPKVTGRTLKEDAFGLMTGQEGQSTDTTPDLGKTSADASKLVASTTAQQAGLADIAAGNSILVRGSGLNIDPNGDGWVVIKRNDPQVLGNDNLVPMVQNAYNSWSPDGGKTVVGGAAGEVRYGVAVPVKAEGYQYQDPNTGAYTGKLADAPGVSGEIGKQVQIMGPAGVPITLYGVYKGGQLLWTKDDPFTPALGAKATSGTDPKTGAVTISYTMDQAPVAIGATGKKPPTPVFGTAQILAQIGAHLVTADDPGFNPATDRATAYGSPLEAMIHTSEPSMRWATSVGSTAIRNAETQWYSNPSNWTPKMQQNFSAARAAGVPPDQAANAVVTQQASVLPNAVSDATWFGTTPEQQDQTRATLAARMADIMAPSQIAAGAARTQAADLAARQDLVAQVNKWGLSNANNAPSFQFGIMGGPAGTGPRVNPQGPNGLNLPKGWTINDLLTQPGMNTGQAQDLAAQITGGAVGQREQMPDFGAASWQTPGGVYQTPTRGMGNLKPPAYVNPFMPKPGAAPPHHLDGLLGAVAPAVTTGGGLAITPAPAAKPVVAPTYHPPTSADLPKTPLPKYGPAQPF